MKDYLKKLKKELIRPVEAAAQLSAQTGIASYLVGGCVRDLILGANNCDLDITVEGEGIVFAKKLADKLGAQIIVHPRFGTAVLNLAGGLKLDIASTRKEKYPAPGALPVVVPGTLEEDLGRRDFTINAMALRLGREKQEIIDPFGGMADLSAGCVRILHELSFKDDPTRILRAVRFAQRFAFKIEPRTLRLLKDALAGGYLDKVNPHRLRDELILTLKENRPIRPVEKLSALGALSFLGPGFQTGARTRSLFSSASREISRFCANYPKRRKLDCWLIYFAALVEPLGRERAAKIIFCLGMRKGEEKRVLDFLRLRSRIIPALSKTGDPEKVFSLLEPLSYETIILLGASSGNQDFKKNLANFFDAYHGTRICLCGEDIARLGVLPGPQYQKIFAKVLSARLKGKVNSRREELALVKKLLQNQKKRRV